MDNFNLEYETKILKFWEDNKINEKVDIKNKGGKLFSWVEGPPYPTGEAHLGHLRNWAIKDCVFRFNRFCGKEVYTKDGYDVHGLPVEQKVQQKLGLVDTNELKEFGEEKFTNECREYVSSIINEMKDIRKRYALSIDLSKTYVTSNKNYISNSWKFFKEAHKKNLLYKDFKCVAWSPKLETTLSDYEIKDSYAVLNDPSIYVRIKIIPEFISTKYNEYLLIWTTTPWTLEANQAVAINKNFEYSKVLIQNSLGEKYVIVVATKLIETICEKLELTFIETLQTFLGEKLEGVKYEPIYPENKTQKKMQNSHKIIHADFITLGETESHLEKIQKKKSYKHSKVVEEEKVENTKNEKKLSEGTGLAHQAPAHGMDDFEICRKLGIDEAYCIVNKKGEMIEESRYNGMNFKKCDKEVISYLENSGQILKTEFKNHKYPLCWRSKVPIVYRTTEQWYIKRSEKIEDMLKENTSNVEWHPNSAKTHFNNLLKGSGDWAISRQRFWGIPIPIFENEKKDKFIVIENERELEELTLQKFEDLHLTDLKNLEIKKNGEIYKHVNYICDVRFDSGCASFASHYDEELTQKEIFDKYYPLDFITEGEDQMRGWFSSLFNVGHMITEKAPYKNVLFYRFVMDKNGVKMSKSIGNGISGTEAIKNWGTDATRYYLLTKSTPEEQLNFDPKELVEVNGYLKTLDNVFKFTNNYLNLHKIKNTILVESEMNVEDKWIIYKLNILIKNFKQLQEKYKFNLANKELANFITNDFSKIYLKIVKERCEKRCENLVIIFSKVINSILILNSITIPFKSEELYSQFNGKIKESIFLEDYPYIDELSISKYKHIDIYFNEIMLIIQKTLNLRERAKIGLRWPLYKLEVSLINDKLESKLNVFNSLIEKLTNVKKIRYEVSEFEYLIKPNFLEIKSNHNNPKIVIDYINQNKDKITKSILKNENEISTQDFTIDLKKDVLKEIIVDKNKLIYEFKFGTIVLETFQDETLLEEGYFNEIKRRIQQLRKEKDLNQIDKITLNVNGSSDYILSIIEMFNDKLCEKCQIESIENKEIENSNEFPIKNNILKINF